MLCNLIKCKFKFSENKHAYGDVIIQEEDRATATRRQRGAAQKAQVQTLLWSLWGTERKRLAFLRRMRQQILDWGAQQPSINLMRARAVINLAAVQSIKGVNFFTRVYTHMAANLN